MNAKDFGFFVRITDSSSGFEKEGLVHIAQITPGAQRLERPEESGFSIGDTVWAKLTQVREDGKLSLSMKDCDQATGSDISAVQDGRNLLKRSLA